MPSDGRGYPTESSGLRKRSLRLDLAFGAFWIVMAVAALLVPPRGHLWPALLCVCWAALGGYIVGQAVQELREERSDV